MSLCWYTLSWVLAEHAFSAFERRRCGPHVPVRLGIGRGISHTRSGYMKKLLWVLLIVALGLPAGGGDGGDAPDGGLQLRSGDAADRHRQLGRAQRRRDAAIRGHRARAHLRRVSSVRHRKRGLDDNNRGRRPPTAAFTVQSPAAVYMAFMVNFSAAQAAGTTSPTSTSTRHDVLRPGLRASSSGGGMHFGITTRLRHRNYSATLFAPEHDAPRRRQVRPSSPGDQ